MGHRVLRVLLMGPPGGGKGTVGKMMATDFGFNVVSTGDALRREIERGSPEGLRAQAVIKSGGLVPDHDMTVMLRNLLANVSDTSFILDGYPRTLAQAKVTHGSSSLRW